MKIKNSFYIFLAALQVACSLLFFFLLASIFGATIESDRFLISVSIITSVQLLQLMFLEQFLYFYHQQKAKSPSHSKSHYQTALLFAFAIGFTFFIAVIMLTNVLLLMFSNPENAIHLKIELHADLIKTLAIGLIFYPITFVNDRLLNAEKRFAAPYISETMPFLFMSIYLILGDKFAPEAQTINSLSNVRVLGFSAAAVLTLIIIFRQGFFTKLDLKFNSDFRKYVKNSLKMRFSHNLHNFGLVLITNYFLFVQIEGVASVFHFALKGITIIKQVIIGPFYRIFQTQLSTDYSRSNFQNLSVRAKRFRLRILAQYIIFVFLVWIFLPSIFEILAPQQIEEKFYSDITTTFALIGIWHLFMVFDLPQITLLMAAQNYKVFFRANLTFIICLMILVSFDPKTSIAQFISYLIICHCASSAYFFKMFRKEALFYED